MIDLCRILGRDRDWFYGLPREEQAEYLGWYRVHLDPRAEAHASRGQGSRPPKRRHQESPTLYDESERRRLYTVESPAAESYWFGASDGGDN